MFRDTRAFSGFSVDDVARAQGRRHPGLETSVENGIITPHLGAAER